MLAERSGSDLSESSRPRSATSLFPWVSESTPLDEVRRLPMVGVGRVGRRFTTMMNSDRNEIEAETVDIRMTIKFTLRRTDFT